MTLRQRISLYYTFTLLCSLILVGYWSWVEFGNQLVRIRQAGVESVTIKNGPAEEALEIVRYAGLPAVLIGLVSGVFLMKRALRPIKDLTLALENTDVSTLSEPVARSGNGDELDRMTAVFNHMKERLEASFTQTREFTLHASHELKTPLTIMHSALEQMLAEDVPPAIHKDRVASLLEEVQRLATIVGQLAFLAKVDAKLLTTYQVPLPLHELVSEMVEDLRVLAAAKSITVTVEECNPAVVKGDRMRLRQLFLNLADNAVKHNHGGGTVNLALRPDGDQGVFQITNTGILLSPEQCSRVFERFFRGNDSHGTATEGSGLGLSIAQSIASAHGGTIHFDATPDGKTCVTVSLPLIQLAHQ